jgi:hypothetical protein
MLNSTGREGHQMTNKHHLNLLSVLKIEMVLKHFQLFKQFGFIYSPRSGVLYASPEHEKPVPEFVH